MKRVYLMVLLALIAAVILVAAIEYDPGYVLVSYGVYTIESSLWVGLLVFIILFLAVYFFFSFLRGFIHRSQSFRDWFFTRGYRRSQQQTTQGLIAFTEGNWKQARRILSRAAAKSETPLLNYLMAARASHAIGDKDQVKTLLKRAEQSVDGATTAVGLTQADMQIQSGNYEQALATLTRLRKNSTKYPYVIKLLKKVYCELEDWQGLFDLLPDLKKHRLIDDKGYSQLAIVACKGCLLEASKVRDNPLTELNDWWKKFPKSVITHSEVVACFVECLLKFDGEVQAEKMIREQLKRDWDRKLVDLYGRIAGDDVAKQLLHAERWLQERNNDPALFLCLGRLSMRNSLWGKAREYLETSLKLENSAIVCAELGRLLTHLGEHEQSNHYFQQGLINISALPELPMPDKAVMAR